MSVLDVHISRLAKICQLDRRLPGSGITIDEGMVDEGDIEVMLPAPPRGLPASTQQLGDTSSVDGRATQTPFPDFEHPLKKRKLMSGESLSIPEKPQVAARGGAPSRWSNVSSNSTHAADSESKVRGTERPRHSRFELVVERYGRTVGPQESERRQQQGLDLLKTLIPAMYGWTDKVEWLHFISELPEGLCIAACLESHPSNEELSPDALDFLAGFGDDKSDLDSVLSPLMPERRREALQEAAQRFMVRQCTWLLGDATRKKRLPEHPVESLDGKEIRINQQGGLAFRVVHPHGLCQTITMGLGRLSPLVPSGPDDCRTIHFTESGIDIGNSQGATILPRPKWKDVTFSASEISSYGCGSDLIAIWELITGRRPPTSSGGPGTSRLGTPKTSVLADHSPCAEPINPVAAEKKGHGIPMKRPKTGIPNEPPQQDDALWLLNEYLNLYFPNGGDFWTGDKASFPKSTDDKNRFLAFLKSPPYSIHPYATDWQKLLLVQTKQFSALPTSLSFLRTTQSSRPYAPLDRVPEGQKSLQCHIWKIGPRKSVW